MCNLHQGSWGGPLSQHQHRAVRYRSSGWSRGQKPLGRIDPCALSPLLGAWKRYRGQVHAECASSNEWWNQQSIQLLLERILGDLRLWGSSYLVAKTLGGNDGNLIADSLVGLEIESQLGVIPLNDDLGGLLDSLSSNASHDCGCRERFVGEDVVSDSWKIMCGRLCGWSWSLSFHASDAPFPRHVHPCLTTTSSKRNRTSIFHHSKVLFFF